MAPAAREGVGAQEAVTAKDGVAAQEGMTAEEGVVEQEGVTAQERSQAIARVAPNLTPPPGNPRFPLFDSLRAIAALSVFFGHTITETVSLSAHKTLYIAAVQLADQGVAVFFLISGFLLYRPFLTARRDGRRFSVSDFARRRVLRIVPAYWVALSVFLVLGLVSGVTTHNWWVFYGFGQIYSWRTIGHGIGAAWTLCIEMTFYAALPVFALLAAKLGRERTSVRGDVLLLIAFSIGSLAFRAHYHSFADFARVSTLPGTFVWFALGMGLAALSVKQRSGSRSTALVARSPLLFWVGAIAGSALLYYVRRTYLTVPALLFAHVLYGLVALLVLVPGVFADEAGGLPRRILRHRLLTWVGLVSYAYYLYHPVVISEIAKITTFYPAVLVLSALVTAACAAASYYIVERPMMRLRHVPLLPALRARLVRGPVEERAGKLR